MMGRGCHRRSKERYEQLGVDRRCHVAPWARVHIVGQTTCPAKRGLILEAVAERTVSVVVRPTRDVHC